MNWIPVEEKLPKGFGNYLVSVKLTSKTDPDFEYKFVMIDHYNGDGKWTENNAKDKKVIAWAPVPDVYEIEKTHSVNIDEQQVLLDVILPSLQDEESATLFNKISVILYETYGKPMGAALCAVITYIVKELKKGRDAN